MSNGSANRDGSGRIRSVDRAVTVMEHLARRGWSGVTDIAGEMEIHKSTAFRLLSTLARRGMVEQHSETNKYRLGHGLVRLASAVNVDLDLRRRVRPACEALAELTRETVNIAVLDRGEVVHIDQVVGSVSVVHLNWLGRRTPPHCTASGKILLANLPDAQRRRFLDGSLERFTPHTVVDPDVLDDEFVRARSEGYATTVEEFELGLNAVAAPIYVGTGDVIASLVVSGPAQRVPPDRLIEFGGLTREAAEQATESLGGSSGGFHLRDVQPRP